MNVNLSHSKQNPRHCAYFHLYPNNGGVIPGRDLSLLVDVLINFSLMSCQKLETAVGRSSRHIQCRVGEYQILLLSRNMQSEGLVFAGMTR